jgi:hypothetical protein
VRRGGALGRLTAPIAQQLGPQTGLLEALDLLASGDDLEAAAALTLRDVKALALELEQLLRALDVDLLGVQPVRRRRGRDGERQRGEHRKRDACSA